MVNELVLKDVTKSYGDHLVLNRVSLQFELGKTYVFLGPSGCGKTTLLRVLMGLEKIDSGKMTDLNLFRKSAVFQEDRLCEELSVIANIRMVCTKDKKEVIPIIEAMMKQIGLESISRKPVKELSGGMKRRVSILRALLAPSDILFFDEACKGLDAKTKESVMRLIVSHIQDKTVFWVTHDETELSSFDSYEVLHFDIKNQPKLIK